MPLSAVWVVVALLAVLVAAAVPALIQLKRTLAVAERTIESTGRRADQALDELSRTLARVNRAASDLEAGTQRAASLFRALGEIGESLGRLKSSIGAIAKVGGAVGPMLVAALRAVLGGGEKPAGREEDGEPLPSAAARDVARHPEPLEVES